MSLCINIATSDYICSNYNTVTKKQRIDNRTTGDKQINYDVDNVS